MRYFLSYIEIEERHSALWLSEQKEDISGPAIIVIEIGFSTSNHPVLMKRFSTQAGSVFEEQYAGRVRYKPYGLIRHRTYEISQAEMERFFTVINQDRRLNLPRKRPKHLAGGPDYNLFTRNCKTYVLQVLKEVGIVEAQTLSNWWIQRPNSCNHLLKKLSITDVFCPEKEELIIRVVSVLTKLEEVIKRIATNRETDDSKENTKFSNDIQELLWFSERLLEQQYKIGYKSEINQQFTEIATRLQRISSDQTIEDLNWFLRELAEIPVLANKMIEFSKKDGMLSFFWNDTPPTVERLEFDSFTIHEKALYAVRVKIKDALDGLEQIMSEIELKNQFEHNEDEDDFLKLKAIIQGFQQRLQINAQAFAKKIEAPTPEDIVYLCEEQCESINVILNELENEIFSFKLTDKEVSGFLEYLHIIINYLKKVFFGISDYDVLPVKKSVSALKISSTCIDNKFRKHYMFFPYKDIEKENEKRSKHKLSSTLFYEHSFLDMGM